MFENIKNIFKKTRKKEMLKSSSKDTAKERLHLVLMQDRANVSADFLDLMRKEIIEVIKKYIDIDEDAMDVRLTTETSEEGIQGAPALYANIPIINIKDKTKKVSNTNHDKKIITQEETHKEEEKGQENKENSEKIKNEEKEETKKEENTQDVKQKENADDINLQEKNKSVEEEKKKNEK